MREKFFLNHQWSLEQISARLKMEGFTYTISYNTIYRGIYSGLFDEPGLSHLNRGLYVSLGTEAKAVIQKIMKSEEVKLSLAI